MFADQFYSLAELAEVLKVSKTTVWRKAHAGEIPPMDPVFKRFRGDHLREWMDAGRKPWCEYAQSA